MPEPTGSAKPLGWVVVGQAAVGGPWLVMGKHGRYWFDDKAEARGLQIQMSGSYDPATATFTVCEIRPIGGGAGEPVEKDEEGRPYPCGAFVSGDSRWSCRLESDHAGDHEWVQLGGEPVTSEVPNKIDEDYGTNDELCNVIGRLIAASFASHDWRDLVRSLDGKVTPEAKNRMVAVTGMIVTIEEARAARALSTSPGTHPRREMRAAHPSKEGPE